MVFQLEDFYSRDSVLGRGAYGTVYKYVRKVSVMLAMSGRGKTEHPKAVAVKELPIQAKQEEMKDAMKEILLLKSLKHRNIIRYYGKAFTPEGNLCIVMELCDGTLDNLIKSSRWLTLGEISYLARQIVQALDCIHSNNIIHRDIKPGNLMLRIDHEDGTSDWETVEVKSLTVKLGDFGSSRALTMRQEPRTLTMTGTLAYMAPEINKAFTNNRTRVAYNHTADIYSAGKCMLILYLKNLDVADLKEYSLVKLTSLACPHGYAPIFVDFLFKQLDPSPGNRSSAKDLLCHQFIHKEYASEDESHSQHKYLEKETITSDKATKASSGYESALTGQVGHQTSFTSHAEGAISKQAPNPDDLASHPFLQKKTHLQIPKLQLDTNRTRKETKGSDSKTASEQESVITGDPPIDKEALQSTLTGPAHKQFMTPDRIPVKTTGVPNTAPRAVTLSPANMNRRISDGQAVTEKEMDELAEAFQKLYITEGLLGHQT